MENSIKYFYAVNDEQKGPHSLAEITQRIEDGLINRSTLIWKKGMDNWCPAEKFEDTSAAFDEIPPTLPANSKSQPESDEKKVPKIEKNDGLIENRKQAHSFTYAYTIILLLVCIQISFDGLQSVDDIGFYILLCCFPFVDRVVMRRIYKVRNRKFNSPILGGFLISTITLLTCMIFVFLVIESLVRVYTY